MSEVLPVGDSAVTCEAREHGEGVDENHAGRVAARRESCQGREPTSLKLRRPGAPLVCFGAREGREGGGVRK